MSKVNEPKKRTIHLKGVKQQKQPFNQNINDIEKYYKFLGHKSKTVFQVFYAMTNIKSSTKPSTASKQIFIPNDYDGVAKLIIVCENVNLKGVICLGINERPNEQTKITDKLPKINVILFDIDVRKDKKIDGTSPLNLKKEAKEVMEQCKINLEELGFVVDLIVDSGNGYHVYIKIDLDIPKYNSKEDFEETPIYKRLVHLETKLRKLSNKNVEIDFLSKDIMRRAKIPGTYNIKRYKNIDGKFKLIPKDQWRLAKIIYLNENINEKQNNTIFMNLPIDSKITVKKKDTTDIFKLRKNPNILEPNFLERLNKLLEKDEKLKDLYNGIWKKYYPETDTKKGSRSEAEAGFITKLIHYKFNESDIYTIMDNCKIGKWQEKPEAYKKLQIKNAIVFVKKHPKSIFSKKQEEQHLLYYEETKQFPTYKRDEKEAETRAFKKWSRKKTSNKVEKELNNDDIKGFVQNLNKDTHEGTIVKILEKISSFETNLVNKFVLEMMEKTGKEKFWFNNQLEIIYVENLAKENDIDLNLLTITREETHLIASKLDLNRPGSITGFFLAFKKNCGLNRESVCLTLLPNIEDLMNNIIEKFPMFILDETNYIYLYNKSGVYIKESKKPEEIIEGLVINEIPFYIKQVAGDIYFVRRVKTITKEIIIRIYLKHLDFNLINVKNGILKISEIKEKKWILHPHNHQFKSIFQLNINFNPFITTKNKILLNTLKLRLGEQLVHLLKLYGVALLGKPYKYKTMTFLVGPSGTGKSEVIFRILEYIVGDPYISHANLHNLCDSKKEHESGLLHNNLINTNGDISGDLLKDPSEINRLTEKEINIDIKYGFKGSILNTISHFYACNRMPIIAEIDRKDIMRRFYTIDVRNDPIPENERDPDYFENLVNANPGEIEHLFCLILSNLSDVLNDKGLKLPSIDERKNKYFRFACPLFSFTNSYIIKYPTNKETKPSETFLINRNYFLEVYNLYRKELSYEPYSSTHKLTAENDSLKYETKLWTRLKDSKRVYIGVEFNPEAIERFKINLEESIQNKLIYIIDNEKQEEEKQETKITEFLPKNQNNEDEINAVISQIIDIFKDNNNKPCSKDSIVQGLEVYHEKEHIEIAFNRMYNNNKIGKSPKGINIRT